MQAIQTHEWCKQAADVQSLSLFSAHCPHYEKADAKSWDLLAREERDTVCGTNMEFIGVREEWMYGMNLCAESILSMQLAPCTPAKKRLKGIARAGGTIEMDAVFARMVNTLIECHSWHLGRRIRKVSVLLIRIAECKGTERVCFTFFILS